MADWTTGLEACRLSGLSVIDKIRALNQLTHASRQSLSPVLLQAIEELIGAATSLRQQVEVARKGRCTSESSTAEAQRLILAEPEGGSELNVVQVPLRPTSTSESDLSGEEIRSLTTNAGDPADKPQDIDKGRYKYECEQTIYRWCESDGAPSIAPGITIRCHDIGAKGISFFQSECPDFERLVISLGTTEKPLFMAAEVMNSKVVYMYGAVGYLVGCRFTARVPEFSERGRVHFNKRRSAAMARFDRSVHRVPLFAPASVAPVAHSSPA
jgi:hypothetical protein